MLQTDVAMATVGTSKFSHVMMRRVLAQTAPAPDIQTDLGASRDGQASVPSLWPTSTCTIRTEVFPEDGIPRNSFEGDTRDGLTVFLLGGSVTGVGRFRVRALNPATPWLVWHISLQERELCAAALDIISLYPDHEATSAPPTLGTGTPIEVVGVLKYQLVRETQGIG